MTRKTSKRYNSRNSATKQDAEKTKWSDRSERLRPSLQLSELVNSDQIRSSLSAHERMTDQLRSVMQLPNLEAISKQAKILTDLANNEQIRNAAALLSRNFDGVISARDLARAAAAAKPALIEHESKALVQTTEQVETRAVLTITSARDLGQLVRKEREKRKLSQQTFADLAGVGRRFISELENGKATLEFDKVLQVASAIGINVMARRRQ